ncbi:hypothetical protein [Pseudonocardia sp. 73-21]|uniref:hypothetical protein n=1 Tax=Pseudonocardia sp. 73-21 TaxID=1895809 RepID=UPI002635921F|nr:hypothetical protein [Pseudonocardia sp. 73-21]
MTQIQTDFSPVREQLNLRVGDIVQVRGEAEILASLDERGELDSLPFMPEMLQYCGQRMTVHKVAHKVCDTITRGGGMRRMSNAVYLSGARCDGQGHGGCQTACQLVWREQWLVRAGAATPPTERPVDGRLLLPLVTANARREPGPDGAELYSCQATELNRAAPTCLPLRDVGQFVQDVRSGNAGVLWALRAFLVGLFNRLQKLSIRFLPPRLRFRRGLRWRFLEGRAVGRTPTEILDLQPGELVRVKSKDAILATLDANLLNRGMGFEEEMSRWCGRVGRVERRVDRCLDERTGRMLTMKNPCIVLENSVCEGAFNAACPREFVHFWREIWLERIS